MSSFKLFSHLLVNFEERIRLTDWLWGNTPRPLILGPNFGKSWSTWPTSHLIMGRPDEDCQDLLQILWASIIIFKLHFLLQCTRRIVAAFWNPIHFVIQGNFKYFNTGAGIYLKVPEILNIKKKSEN